MHNHVARRVANCQSLWQILPGFICFKTSMAQHDMAHKTCRTLVRTLIAGAGRGCKCPP